MSAIKVKQELLKLYETKSMLRRSNEEKTPKFRRIHERSENGAKIDKPEIKTPITVKATKTSAMPNKKRGKKLTHARGI